MRWALLAAVAVAVAGCDRAGKPADGTDRDDETLVTQGWKVRVKYTGRGEPKCDESLNGHHFGEFVSRLGPAGARNHLEGMRIALAGEDRSIYGTVTRFDPVEQEVTLTDCVSRPREKPAARPTTPDKGTPGKISDALGVPEPSGKGKSDAKYRRP